MGKNMGVRISARVVIEKTDKAVKQIKDEANDAKKRLRVFGVN